LYSNSFIYFSIKKFLASISSEKIRLMSSILYKKQHKDDEKPIYDPDEFKKMLEKEELKLQ
jgi:hypothetical protein